MTDFEDVGADFEFFAAIENGRVEDVARLLIFERSTRPRDINRRLNGWAPLLFAIQLAAIRSTSRYDIVRLLLDCGADVNRANSGPGYTNGLGWTPLLLAIRYENTEIVHQLLDRGADVDRADNLGFTPLLLACQIGDADIARLLLIHDADVTRRRATTKVPPLLLAIMRGHSEIARLLLKHGADVDMANNCGHTPLSFATSIGHPEVVRGLLRAGANVNHDPSISDPRRLHANSRRSGSPQTGRPPTSSSRPRGPGAPRPTRLSGVRTRARGRDRPCRIPHCVRREHGPIRALGAAGHGVAHIERADCQYVRSVRRLSRKKRRRARGRARAISRIVYHPPCFKIRAAPCHASTTKKSPSSAQSGAGVAPSRASSPSRRRRACASRPCRRCALWRASCVTTSSGTSGTSAATMAMTENTATISPQKNHTASPGSCRGRR